jgi:hypothetical protein
MITFAFPLSPPLAPGATLPRPAPWAKSASAIAEITATPSSSNNDVTTKDGLWPTQQPCVTGQADAPIPAAQRARTQIGNQLPMNVDAENRSMAIADEEMQAHLRDVEDDQAAAGGDVEGYQQAWDEKRVSEIGPS